MHPRQAIRQAIRDLIVAANTRAGTRVIDGRVVPIAADSVPCVLLFVLSETVEVDDIQTPGYRKRTASVLLKLIQQISIADQTVFQNQLDDFALEVETVMDSDPLLNRSCEAVWLTDTEFLFNEGEQLLGIVNLTYSVQYRG